MNKILLFLLSAAVALCAQDKIYASFDVTAAKDAQLALKAVGIIKTVNVEIGSAVKRGDVLLELENESEKLAVKLAQNDLESAQTAKAHAKSVLDKFKLVQSVSSKQTFENAEKAHEYVNQKGAPIVIKADGLAAGKGVVVAATLHEAHVAIDDMLLGNKMGNAGARVVIEDFLQGEEASFIVVVDGDNVLPMATSQDHKRLLDDDCGPNTGGMGAYSPAPVVTSGVYERAMNEIILPTVNGMKAEGHKFTGFLYAGLMIDKTGAPYTVEFNCRFGDPETQPIMSRLNSDLVDLLEAAIDGKLNSTIAEWNPQTAVGVVLAAENYPDTPKKGDIITGLDEADQIGKVFHAGTALNENGKVVTNGGRVLCVVGLGDNVAAAKTKAYQAVQKISFDGIQYRKDIADKAINR